MKRQKTQIDRVRSHIAQDAWNRKGGIQEKTGRARNKANRRQVKLVLDKMADMS